MILLCGIPSESPLRMVGEQLEALGAPYAIFNQRRFASMELEFEIGMGSVSGWLKLDGRNYSLEQFTGVYTRLMDERLLPELKDEAPDSEGHRHCHSLHEALMRWYEIAPGRVLNRTGPMGSNFSKPYQAQLIQSQGFDIPETLITNDPEVAREFCGRFERVIYKSISGIRSIVQTIQPADLQRLERIRWCPTQFQEFVIGTNVRVHVVGTAAFATAILSEATDYRYATRQVGTAADLEAIQLPEDLEQRCIELAGTLELPLAGIDLKITPEGRVYCFEVNPSPAFSYYEANTGQPIAQAIATYLAEQS